MVTLNPHHELHRIEVEEARRELIPYIKGNIPGYIDGWVHQKIAAALEQFSRDVVALKSPRLMLFMPPRHGKSELSSQNFPAWHLGHHPEHEIIAASYNIDKGEDYSEKALEYAQGEWHKQVFPGFEFKGKKQSRSHWKTKKGGKMLGTGVGGAITGKGAHIVILDDLVKNWEEAISKTKRETAWNFYTSTIRTRLAPGAGIILIMTRWHEDDVAGRLLKKMEENAAIRRWQIIEFPAIAEKDEEFRKNGEALHPERYGLPDLKEIEVEVGPRVWISLYQQKPRPLGGQYIRASWFKRISVAEMPKPTREVRFWDLAVKAAQANDESASVRMFIVSKIPEGGRTPLTYVYLRMMTAYKKEWPDSKKTIIALALAEKIPIGIEANSAFEIAVQEIRADLKGKINVTGISMSTDKLTRALPWMDLAEAGRVFLVDGEGADWIPAFLSECESWDPLESAQADNRIDAVSGAYMMVGVKKMAKII